MGGPVLALSGLPHRTFQNPSFKKGRGLNEDRAKFLGNGRTGTSVRRINREGVMAAKAIRRVETNIVGQTKFVRIDEKQAAKRFSAAVIDFDAATLARISGRSVEAAKLWKAGIRCPNGSSLINMGAVIEEVQAWTNSEMEIRRPRIPVDARSANEELGRMRARLHQQALEPGERGAIARSILNDTRSI